ncbi:MAG TPA: hypothetical protein VL334_12795 [Anaerolineae bacterium]|nr:hypothetical protein [Anaerolineae bacterium]
MIKHNKSGIFIIVLLVLALSGMASAGAAAPDGPDAPVGTAFTYQGRLIDGGIAANGAYDLRFRLFDAATGGAQVGATLLSPDVPVSAGYFTVVLNFADYFDGEARWLEVEVRPGASTGSYTPLTPRTSLAGVPYALGLRPGATVNTTAVNVPALRLNAPDANSNALVATGNGNGYAVVYAEDVSTVFGYGLYGKSTRGDGVRGLSQNGTGVSGEGFDYGVEGYGGLYGVFASGETGGVRGESTSGAAFATGVLGKFNTGISGPGPSSSGVRGGNSGVGGNGIGVWGEHDGAGYGVYGSTPPGGYGVVGSNGGSNSSGYAGSFNGRVAVIGTLSKGGGSFKIDHPLDPANKYLSHSFVESPDMMNIYNGNVTTGADGYATVILPDWFEALNRDFRYQLTVIGQFAQAMVAEEIKDNQFRIQTDQPGVKVSWQVTGIRHDPFAEAYRILVEEEKTGDERGRYLYPDVYGKTVQESIWYASSPNVRYMIDHPEARERLERDALRSDAPSPAQPSGQ